MTTTQDVQNWINANKGKYTHFDQAYGAQCFDLAMQYVYDLFGINTSFPGANGAAKNIPLSMQGWAGWTIGYWSSNSDLQIGDIITWNGYPGTTSPQWGHVAIYAGNGQKFETNGSGHEENDVIGWDFPGDEATLRTNITGGAYMYARPTLDGSSNTSYTTNNNMEEKMRFTYQITNSAGAAVSGVYYYDGTKDNGLYDIDQLTIEQKIYKEITGQELKHYVWVNSAPWYNRHRQATGQALIN
jgi:cell wall-associated NlpC family hydrolase